MLDYPCLHMTVDSLDDELHNPHSTEGSMDVEDCDKPYNKCRLSSGLIVNTSAQLSREELRDHLYKSTGQPIKLIPGDCDRKTLFGSGNSILLTLGALCGLLRLQLDGVVAAVVRPWRASDDAGAVAVLSPVLLGVLHQIKTGVPVNGCAGDEHHVLMRKRKEFKAQRRTMYAYFDTVSLGSVETDSWMMQCFGGTADVFEVCFLRPPRRVLRRAAAHE